MAARKEMGRPADLAARFGRLRAPVEEKEHDDEERFCICRGLDEGAMIACDGGCDDWFHLSCIGMTKKEQDKIEKYVCPAGVEGGKGQIIYKPGIARPASSRYHYVALPPATDQAVSEQYEEDPKLATLLEKEGRSRRASKQANEPRKTTVTGKKERAIPTALPSASRVNPAAKTALKPILKKRRPQIRHAHGPRASPSGFEVPRKLVRRPKPPPQQQSDLDKNTSPPAVHQDDGSSADEMSVDADLERLQEKEDGKALKLEHLEHAYSYDLVMRNMMEFMFGSVVDGIMEDLTNGMTEERVEHMVEEAMQEHLHPVTVSWARTRRMDGAYD